MKVAHKNPVTTLRRLLERYTAVELATLVNTPPAGRQWIHEIKFDGFRLLGFVCEGDARLRTRNCKDWTERFPTIRTALESLGVQSAVIDMEAVVLSNGKSSFQQLQNALGEGGNASAVVAEEAEQPTATATRP